MAAKVEPCEIVQRCKRPAEALKVAGFAGFVSIVSRDCTSRWLSSVSMTVSFMSSSPVSAFTSSMPYRGPSASFASATHACSMAQQLSREYTVRLSAHPSLHEVHICSSLHNRPARCRVVSSTCLTRAHATSAHGVRCWTADLWERLHRTLHSIRRCSRPHRSHLLLAARRLLRCPQRRRVREDGRQEAGDGGRVDAVAVRQRPQGPEVGVVEERDAPGFLPIAPRPPHLHARAGLGRVDTASAAGYAQIRTRSREPERSYGVSSAELHTLLMFAHLMATQLA